MPPSFFFWKTRFQPSGRDSSLRAPAAAASCFSFWARRRYVETLTLNMAWRCLYSTVIMLVICWTVATWPALTGHIELHGTKCSQYIWAFHEQIINVLYQQGGTSQHRSFKEKVLIHLFWWIRMRVQVFHWVGWLLLDINLNSYQTLMSLSS